MSYETMLTTGKARPTYVNIKHQALTPDGYGGYTNTWAVLYRRVSARFNSMTSKEIQMLHDKQEVLADFSVNLKYRSGIKEGMALVKTDDNRTFEIKLVMDWDEDKTQLKLAVKENDKLG